MQFTTFLASTILAFTAVASAAPAVAEALEARQAATASIDFWFVRPGAGRPADSPRRGVPLGQCQSAVGAGQGRLTQVRTLGPANSICRILPSPVVNGRQIGCGQEACFPGPRIYLDVPVGETIVDPAIGGIPIEGREYCFHCFTI